MSDFTRPLPLPPRPPFRPPLRLTRPARRALLLPPPCHPRCRHSPATPFARSLVIPALEDRSTLQQTLSRVLDQVANGMLDLPSARVLLYGLQIAQSNLPPHKLAPPATENG